MSRPRVAEAMLEGLIVDARSRDALLGDLAEEWAGRAARQGERAATGWY